MAAHTVSMVASTTSPYTLSLSDDEGHNAHTSQEDQNFTTDVNSGDTIQWLLGTNSNIRSIDSITANAGQTNMFSDRPTSANLWKGTIGAFTSGTTEEYTIGYTTSNGTSTTQDPKMKMGGS